MLELSTEASPVAADAAPASAGRTRLTRPRPVVLAGALVAIAGLLFGGIATASAHDGGGDGDHGNGGPTASGTPVRGDSIPNLTLVENQIKAYYGDTVLANGDHVPSTTGNYAKEVNSIEVGAARYLTLFHSKSSTRKKAVVLDVDDTSLNTYNYEIFSGFAYNPTTNAEYVNDARFPEVYGMPALAGYAASRGYTVFFITGRPEAQRAGTVANLAKVGYSAPDADHLFLKNKDNPPSYLSCGATCTTSQYKTGTRAHVESLGYEIVGNFGDQYSDLVGGYSDRTFKLPNPMYFLP